MATVVSATNTPPTPPPLTTPPPTPPPWISCATSCVTVQAVSVLPRKYISIEYKPTHTRTLTKVSIINKRVSPEMFRVASRSPSSGNYAPLAACISIFQILFHLWQNAVHTYIHTQREQLACHKSRCKTYILHFCFRHLFMATHF